MDSSEALCITKPDLALTPTRYMPISQSDSESKSNEGSSYISPDSEGTTSSPGQIIHPGSMVTARSVSPTFIGDNLEAIPPLDVDSPKTGFVETSDIVGHIHNRGDLEESSGSALSKASSSDDGDEGFHLLGAATCGTQYQQLPSTDSKMLGLSVDAEAPMKTAVHLDVFFVHWNWPLIRRSCLFVNLAVWLAFAAVCVALIITMPRKCDPYRRWYQGSVMYELFPASFQDTNGDGIGDLKGVMSRLDYLEDLGVAAVRLNSIYKAEVYPSKYEHISNLTEVDPVLGTEQDLSELIEAAHSKNMRVILDLYVAPISEALTKRSVVLENGLFEINTTELPQTGSVEAPDFRPSITPTVDMRHSQKGRSLMAHVMKHWLSLGIDGFFLRDLDFLTNDIDLAFYMLEWRDLLDEHQKSEENSKVLIAPLQFLQQLKAHHDPDFQTILGQLDLLDAYVDMQTNDPQQIQKQVEQIQSWDNSPFSPWISWRSAGLHTERLTNVLEEFRRTHGLTLFQMILPGSVTLYYGEEIGLTAPDGTDPKLSPLSIMQWSDDQGAGFTADGVRPWLPLSSDHRAANVVVLYNTSISNLKTAIRVHQTEPPLYINGIFNYEGDFHPTRASNLGVRHVDASLLVVDRFYPRQSRWCVLINLGTADTLHDLSNIFYGANVVVSSSLQMEGYIRFKGFRLRPGEAVIVRLDR